MADLPKNKPSKDIKAGDIISAKWLNKVKNSEVVSVAAPLTMTVNANGKVISHGEHGPAVRWGSVVSDYVWSDATYVEVFPMKYTEASTGISSSIITSDTDSKIKVYVTNPIASDVTEVSDITKGITLKTSDIISYMWFGQRCGTMMGAVNGLGTAVTPTEILPTSFEGTSDANSDTWDITSDYGSYDGVKFKLTTRTLYDEDEGEILYGFYRTFTVTNKGNIINISSETRYIIDEPVDCDTDVDGGSW